MLVDVAAFVGANKGDMAVKAVEIQAELRQIKTMADHSTNVTLNIGEQYGEQVKVLFDWLLGEVGLVIVSPEVDEPHSREKAGDGRARRKR